MKEWISYDEKKPTEEGVYECRVPSTSLPGMVVTFKALMCPRNTISTQVLAPSFSGWDGWRLTLPKYISWRVTENPDLDPISCGYSSLGVEGVEFHQCPYCSQSPTLQGWRYASGGGVILPSDPFNYNAWKLRCCEWGWTPVMQDPRKIEEIRRNAFARMKGK